MATMHMPMMPSKTSRSSGASFPKSQNGTSVRVSPGKGGVSTGTPRHCESKRSASNLKGVYGSSY